MNTRCDILTFLKKKIKSNRDVYAILLPTVERIRSVRYLLRRTPAQHFRDCCYALTQSMPEALFVNVGANDGITNTPGIRILLNNANWRGLLIEPVPYCFDQLKKNFPDQKRFILKRVAIGNEKKPGKFYYIDRKAEKTIKHLPPWYNQLGSFDKAHIIKHMPEAGPFIKEIDVEVCSLSEVLYQSDFTDFHLLHIDAEGYDLEVLKTLDFSLSKPIIIYIEHKHLMPIDRKILIRMLKSHGYSVYDAGDDYFALNKKLFRHNTAKVSL